LNSRERTLSAMTLEEPDRVPIFEGIINYPVLEKILGYPGRSDNIFGARYYEVKDYFKAFLKVEMDCMPAFYGAPRDWKTKRINGNKYQDVLGHLFSIVDEGGYKVRRYAGPGLKTYDEFLEFPWWDPNLPGWVDPVEIWVKLAHKEDMAAIGVVLGPIQSNYCSLGMERYFPLFYRDPGLAKRLIEKHARLWMGLAEQMVGCGVDAVVYGDDVAYKGGPFVSPAKFREIVIPFYRNMVYAVKKHDVPCFFHSDGNLYSVLDDLVDAGFEGLHAIEPIAGMDIGRVKERWGNKIFLVGNIDCSHTLTIAPLRTVIKETKETIAKASVGGGHIMSSSNSLHNAVNIKNYLTMINTTKKYGRYPLEL